MTRLRNARIPGDPDVRDLELRDGDEDVDLDGRWVIPGLWDHHVHFGAWAMVSRRVDVSAARSAAEAAAIVRAAVADEPPHEGAVVIGHGFRDGLWPDAPSPALLEVGDVPVVLVSADVHCTWANRAALRRFGRPDAAWLLREQPAFDLQRELADVGDGVLDAWALDAAAAAAARGVVGIHDFEMSDAVGAWRRRFDAGFRGLRVAAVVYPHDLDTVAGLGTGDRVDGSGLLEVGPLKLFADGSLNTRTAWCRDAYPGTADVGLPTYGPDELLAAARDGLARGLTPAIHAIGDAAVALALDTFAALGIPGRVEHAQLVADGDLPRFAALGVRASVQPEHAMDDRDVADRYWAGRTARSFAYRSLADADAELRFGSDAPVAPLDPLATMDAAITRARDGREPWHPEQALSFETALAASTGGRVRADDGGSADLVVLDADPRTTPLRTIPVAATMLAGAWTHSTL